MSVAALSAEMVEAEYLSLTSSLLACGLLTKSALVPRGAARTIASLFGGGGQWLDSHRECVFAIADAP